MVAMAFGALTSCEDAPATPPMQKNEPVPVIAVSEVVLEPTELLAGGQPVNLDSYVDNSIVTLFKISKNGLPEGFTLLPYVELSDAQDFKSEENVTLPLTVAENEVLADLSEWHEAHLAIFGDDDQSEKTVYYRVAANIISDNGVEFHFGMPDHYMAEGSVKEVPMVSIMTTDYWFTPGSSNNWTAANSQYLYNTNNVDKPFYYGSILVSGEGFKIADTKDWSGTNYGGDNGVLSTSGANIAPFDGNGLYWIQANFNDLTYTMVKINTVSVIGGGDWDNDRNLTPNEDQSEWTADVNLDGEWKIRINGNWDYNYGGKLKNPNLDGNNFAGTGGMATVTVVFSGHHPVVKVTAK